MLTLKLLLLPVVRCFVIVKKLPDDLDHTLAQSYQFNNSERYCLTIDWLTLLSRSQLIDRLI